MGAVGKCRDCGEQKILNPAGLCMACSVGDYFPIRARAEKDQLLDLRAEVEQLRVQLAGCSVAALGYDDTREILKQGDFGWSASFQDVVTLRRKYEALFNQVGEMNTLLWRAKEILGSRHADLAPSERDVFSRLVAHLELDQKDTPKETT